MFQSVRKRGQVNSVFHSVCMKVVKRIGLGINSHKTRSDVLVYIVTDYLESPHDDNALLAEEVGEGGELEKRESLMHDGVSGGTGRVDIVLTSEQLLDGLTCDGCPSTEVEVRGDNELLDRFTCDGCSIGVEVRGRIGH